MTTRAESTTLRLPPVRGAVVEDSAAYAGTATLYVRAAKETQSPYPSSRPNTLAAERGAAGRLFEQLSCTRGLSRNDLLVQVRIVSAQASRPIGCGLVRGVLARKRVWRYFHHRQM